MYNTSQNYKNKVYDTRHILRIFIDDIEINSKYILDFEASCKLFDNDEFALGTVCARTVKLKLYKDAVPNNIGLIKITTGIIGEEIPFGEFIIDSKSEIDEYTVELDLIDNMSKFEFLYDGSKLSYPATIFEILQDICLKAGVELRFYFFFK